MTEELVYCPFCDKQTIKVFRSAGFLGSKVSRGSGCSKSVASWTPERMNILSGCSACGATKEQVRDELL